MEEIAKIKVSIIEKTEENTNKRRDFLKNAGLFAGTLALTSIFKSNIANAALTLQSKQSGKNHFKILDNGSATFLPDENNRIELTSDGNMILTRRFTSSYIFKGLNGMHLVALPPGMHYPISQVWGYDYNFVKEVKINGTPISFSEINAAEKDGARAGTIGTFAYGGFAWSVRSLSGPAMTGDTIEATLEYKELISSVKGIRVGIDFNPDSVVPKKTYSYATRHDIDDPTIDWDFAGGKSPNKTVFWNYPTTNEYAVAIFRLTKYKQACHKAVGPSGSIKIGRHWKPYKTVEATDYKDGIYYNGVFGSKKRRNFKLAVFHKPTGAISELSREIIIDGNHHKASNYSWEPTLKIKG